MFLFNCCQQFNTGRGYQLKDNNGKEVQFTRNIKQLSLKSINKPSHSIIQMKKSQYQSILQGLESSQKLFTDYQFAPNQDSLGYIEGLSQVKWKRISDIIPSPILLPQKISPSQIIKGSLGDCYFLSALATLAQNQELILNIFGDQKYNKKGIYKIPMQIKGQIQQVIVDDFIPTNQNGEPLFCQPNHNEFWVLILQKVWAKINGSYAKIIMGTPSQIFRCFTFAPSEMISIKQKNEQKQRLWNKLVEYSKRSMPVCCKTLQSMQIINNLQPSHTFTFLCAALLQDTQGIHHKIIKLRDPWGTSMWTGAASEKDKSFWNKIIGDSERKQFEKLPKGGNKGIFYINFNNFCQYFKQIHSCFIIQCANYVSQELISNRKNGNLYKFKVQQKGYYSFSLNQFQINELKDQQQDDETACRSTLLIIKCSGQANDYDFINGLLKYNEENASLTEQLDKGNYILFAKIDPTRNKGLMPSSIIIGLYSSHFTSFQPVQKLKFPNLLKETFLKHAREHKKNQYNNNLMWVSSKLLFQQGGYAYIAFGNDKNSNKKFIIDFERQQFSKLSFKIKGQFKGIDRAKIQIMPGQQKIFLSRVQNKMIKALKFPPAIGIKMDMIE